MQSKSHRYSDVISITEKLWQIKCCLFIHLIERFLSGIKRTILDNDHIFQTIFSFQRLFKFAVSELNRIDHFHAYNSAFFSLLKHSWDRRSGYSKIVTDFLLSHIIFIIQAADLIDQSPIIYNLLHWTILLSHLLLSKLYQSLCHYSIQSLFAFQYIFSEIMSK